MHLKFQIHENYRAMKFPHGPYHILAGHNFLSAHYTGSQVLFFRPCGVRS